MPAALLKLDENIPDLVAEILGAAGHDVALARDEQLSGVEDETLLGAAITEARALVTFDLHFSDIRRHDPSGTPGIVVLRLRSQSLPPVRRAALALRTCSLRSRLRAVCGFSPTIACASGLQKVAAEGEGRSAGATYPGATHTIAPRRVEPGEEFTANPAEFFLKPGRRQRGGGGRRIGAGIAESIMGLR